MARVKYARPEPQFLPASEVWAAAIAAQRINGIYLKYDEDWNNGPIRYANKVLIRMAITHGWITDQDRARVDEIRSYFQGLIFRQLSGQAMTDFDRSSLTYATAETISDQDYLAWGVIASLPAAWERAMARQAKREREDALLAASTHIGTPGQRIKVTARIINSRFSHKYMTTFFTALVDNTNLIFFAFNHHALLQDQVYELTGTVKGHRESGQTQLNRVKIHG